MSQGITVPPTNAQMRSVTPQVIAQAVGNLGGNRMNQSERGTNHRDTNDTSAQMSAGQRERERKWLEDLDANRKYNLILFRINDTNNKNEDNKVVEGMMRAIGCAHRISEKTNIIRLGAKRNGNCRPLMVCFSNDNAVNQVLARSPNLCRSTLYGPIYVIAQSKWEQKLSQIRKKSQQTGTSFILFFKWSLILVNFWALKNLGGMCRNFEKRVEKNSFLQIFSLKLIL